jgi:DNA-3-methyladenine glycosylase
MKPAPPVTRTEREDGDGGEVKCVMRSGQNSGDAMRPQLQGPGPDPFPRSFYEAETASVARALLGCVLVRRAGGAERQVVIVETEAYLGVADRAAHTWGGRRTPRVLPMWGPGGHAYVYRVYGLHHCMNVVTREEGVPEAVLVRAAVPEAWWADQPVPREELLAASGPGRLCRHLSIDCLLSGAPLSGPDLEVRAGAPREFQVLAGRRVGVDYAGKAAAWTLRFAVDGCPAVTARKSLRLLRASGRRGGPRSRETG